MLLVEFATLSLRMYTSSWVLLANHYETPSH
jgi:hypothetical protein